MRHGRLIITPDGTVKEEDCGLHCLVRAGSDAIVKYSIICIRLLTNSSNYLMLLIAFDEGSRDRKTGLPTTPFTLVIFSLVVSGFFVLSTPCSK